LDNYNEDEFLKVMSSKDLDKKSKWLVNNFVSTKTTEIQLIGNEINVNKLINSIK